MQLRASLQAHVLKRQFSRLAFRGVMKLAWRRHGRCDATHLARVGAPRHLRFNVGALKHLAYVILGSSIGRQLFPTFHGAIKLRALWHHRSTLEIVERDLIGRNHTSACTGFDRHVANRHALFHRQRSHAVASVLDDITGSASGPDLADQIEDHVFGGDTGRQLAIDSQFQRLRFELQQGLSRKHMFDFAGTDAKGQCAKRAVSRCVAVTADDDHAGLSVAILRTDHMNDALSHVMNIKQRDPKLFAVRTQRFNLLAADFVCDRQTTVAGRHIVIGCRDGAFRSANGPLVQSQSVKGLRAGDFVNQVQIDIQNRRFAGGAATTCRSQILSSMVRGVWDNDDGLDDAAEETEATDMLLCGGKKAEVR